MNGTHTNDLDKEILVDEWTEEMNRIYRRAKKIIATYGKEFYITGNQKIIIEFQSIIFHLF